ncbi:MAG: 4Fe-4S dicluster domain-containing protein, partial [Planctomycetes bacterium]|nr:4Fe-4S dicluster domain-containing protein [Planctomycetota bacterium]
VPRRGACAPDCTRCGEVCPTGAIPRLDAAAKAERPIGVAVIDEERCIPFQGRESCLVCEEHCPVADKAIRLKPGPQGIDVPHVRRRHCTGCGWCELVCPLEGEAAIRVVRRAGGDDG